MHVMMDRIENFETLLSADMGIGPLKPVPLPSEDTFDAGYKLVSALSDDLALDMLVLDMEGDS